MGTLRVCRLRLVLYEPPSMGQLRLYWTTFHHLEGYHIQTLDLGTLMGDSTRVSLLYHPDKLVFSISPPDRGSHHSSTIH